MAPPAGSPARELYGQLIPTVTERRMPTAAEHLAYVDENRRRAAHANDHPELVPVEGAQRVWSPRPVAEVLERLGSSSLAVWAESDVLHILWRGHSTLP